MTARTFAMRMPLDRSLSVTSQTYRRLGEIFNRLNRDLIAKTMPAIGQCNPPVLKLPSGSAIIFLLFQAGCNRVQPPAETPAAATAAAPAATPTSAATLATQ